MFFRASYNDKKIEIVAINDLTSPEVLAHLLKYDSTHGTFSAKVKAEKSRIIVEKEKIPIYAIKDPNELPWREHKVDLVLEATGRFTNPFDAQAHLKVGAKKVLLSAPSKCHDTCQVPNVTIIKGVNEKDYLKNKEKIHIISNASCTSNCVAPVLKVIDKEFGIKKCFFSTVHAYTATEALVDRPGKDLRKSRAAAVNIIPTTTGANKAVALTLPKLKGKLSGMAYRVPVINGSVTDFTIEIKKGTTKEKVNAVLKKAASKELKDVLAYSEQELVSSDIIGNSHSSIIDGKLTTVLDKHTVKIVSWYDNEWGYSNRLVDIAKILL